MNVIFIAILSFMSVVGAVTLFRKLLFWLYKPQDAPIYLGAALNSADNTEVIVRSLIQRIRWMELGSPVRLILINRAGDPEINLIAKKIICKFPNITLLSYANKDYNIEK